MKIQYHRAIQYKVNSISFFRNAFGSTYRPALGLNGYIVTVDECEFIERKIEGTNKTVKYLQQDRLFLLRDFEPDFEQADISIVITVRDHHN